MRTWKLAAVLLIIATMAACQTQEESEERTEEITAQPQHLDDADPAMNDNEMGTDREGIEKKDLDKKSADFDPDEVKLDKDSE